MIVDGDESEPVVRVSVVRTGTLRKVGKAGKVSSMRIPVIVVIFDYLALSRHIERRKLLDFASSIAVHGVP